MHHPFQYLLCLTPLGHLYGSSGGFLSPENLVGRSNNKFPPDAVTIAGLILNELGSKIDKRDFYVTGPFWASQDSPQNVYVPMPFHRVFGETNHDRDEWILQDRRWYRDRPDLEPNYSWLKITDWQRTMAQVGPQSLQPSPWRYTPMLHPQLQPHQRVVQPTGGLFLEQAVQLDDQYCLVYLVTHTLEDGWYRFGGEGHLAEIRSFAMRETFEISKLLSQPIDRDFALLTPGIWSAKYYPSRDRGTPHNADLINRYPQHFTHRYPKHPDFPRTGLKMLTDKAVSYRYRLKGRLGRGRYAVPSGSVYALSQPLNKTWWDFPEPWFPREGRSDSANAFSLKHFGCGLALPITLCRQRSASPAFHSPHPAG